MSKIELEHILGSSTATIKQLAYAQECLIYISGSFLIFYNPVVDEQIAYLKHATPLISCLAASPCEKLLAVCSLPLQSQEKTMENQSRKATGITVYNLGEIGLSKPEITLTLRGHKHAIDHVIFSPDSKYLLTICNKDGSMFVWDIKSGERLTQNKNSRGINSVRFNGQELITCGRGNCKVWQFYEPNSKTILRTNEEEHWMLTGRTLPLSKKFSTKEFIEISFYSKYILLLTSCGLLCLLSEEKLEKCIDLMMKTTTMDVHHNTIMCGGENAVVKVVDLEGLMLLRKFPKPPPKLKENVDTDWEGEVVYEEGEEFPQCVGVMTIGNNKFSQFIVTLYQNMTMFIWRPEIQDMIAMRSIITHQSRISSIKILEQFKNDLTFFSTISLDNTLRIWHIYKKCFQNRESIDIAQLIGIKRNAYCRNLTRIIYMESEKSVIDIGGFDGKYVGCLADKEFLLYELIGFEIVVHEVFEDVGVRMEVRDKTVYIGFEGGKVGVYEVILGEGKLNKIREVSFNNRIEEMCIMNESQTLAILTANHEMIIYSLQLSKITHIEKQILCVCPSHPNILFYKSNNTIHLYNPSKGKQSLLLSLSHELILEEKITKICSNSLYIVCITDYNRLIVGNLGKSIVGIEQLYGRVNDVAVSESGEIICVGDYGEILIYRVGGDRLRGMEDEVKKWMGGGDWMDGSVFRKREGEGGTGLLGSVVDSVKLRGSVGSNYRGSMELPNVDIEYKNNMNDQSIFNPMDILKQAKNIYNQIDNMEKKNNASIDSSQQAKLQSKDKEKQEEISKDKQNEEEDEGLEQIIMSRNQTKNRPPLQQDVRASKKRIFGLSVTQKNDESSKALESDSGLPEQYKNNLVNSVIHSDEDLTYSLCEKQEKPKTISRLKPNIEPKDKKKEQEKINSIDNFSDFIEEKVVSSQIMKKSVRSPGEFSLTNDQFDQETEKEEVSSKELLDSLEGKIKNERFVLLHKEQLERIYFQLRDLYGDDQFVDRKEVLKEFEKVFGNFASFLDNKRQ